MRTNYHTHTWRCNHATGTEREYVETALENGIEILGFSDHGPQIFPGTYYSNFRMKWNQLEDYINTVLALREEYKDVIQIHVGLEMEYYPNSFSKALPVLREYPIEYMILGQHFLGEEIGEKNACLPTDSRETLRRYCSQVAEGLNTGRFTYLAHPDMLNFTGEESFYRQQVRGLCREANSCGIPLEINLLGTLENRHYPNEVFWQEAAEENCKVILGRDAQNPTHFGHRDALQRGVEIIKKYDLNLLETVDFRKI